jgi:hypothetical protein
LIEEASKNREAEVAPLLREATELKNVLSAIIKNME